MDEIKCFWDGIMNCTPDLHFYIRKDHNDIICFCENCAKFIIDSFQEISKEKYMKLMLMIDDE